MWRLLVVLALCGVSLVQGEQQWSSCNNVTTVQNVSLTELQGTWVSRKVFSRLKDTDTDIICVENEIVVGADKELTMFVKFHVTTENQDKRIHTVRMGYNVSDDNMGRWIYEERLGHDMLVLSADPTNYLVLAMCYPPRRGEQISANIGENFTLHELLVYARRQGGSGNLSEENLAKIIDDTNKTLGLQNYNQFEFNYSEC